MRFRRVAAIAAIVAVVGATTAALVPRAAADRLRPMPALTSGALEARYAADAVRIAQAAGAARRTGNTDLVTALQKMRGHHIIDFNPRGNGLAVQVVGDLARATRIAILVPGSRHVPDDIRLAWLGLTLRRRRRPGRAGAPPRSWGSSRGYRTAWLCRTKHVQRRRPDLGRRHAGRRSATALRESAGPRWPARRAAVPQFPRRWLCGRAQLPWQLPSVAVHAPDAAVAPSCCAGRAVDECRLRHVCGRRLAATLHVLLTLVLDPLWFLGVFAVLTAASPLAVALVRRLGVAAALLPLTVVAAADLMRFGIGGFAWLGWINVVAGG